MYDKSILITGANRGIGLEFVKQFLRLEKKPKHIFATCRQPEQAKDLQEVASANSELKVYKLDVLDYSSYEGLVKFIDDIVGSDGLNLVINNAGILHRHSLKDVTPNSMVQTFEVNAVTPLMLSKALLPLLKKAADTNKELPVGVSRAAIMNISSLMGSMQDNGSGGVYEYRASKAALNMVSKNLAVDLRSSNILVAPLHPGWVKTDMGGADALISTKESVAGLISVMGKLVEDDAGNFYNYRGEKLPW